MYNRRKFLKNAGAASVAGMLLSNRSMASFFKNTAQHPIGIQLFTFFDTIDNDVQGP